MAAQVPDERLARFDLQKYFFYDLANHSGQVLPPTANGSPLLAAGAKLLDHEAPIPKSYIC